MLHKRIFCALYYCIEKNMVWANQRNFFENATTCSKRMRKTLVATQLNLTIFHSSLLFLFFSLLSLNIAL